MNNICKYFLFAFMLMATACASDEPSGTGPLAMEAWIDNDGYPVVILTRSLYPGADGVSITDAVARFAKVTISDGSDTVTLTGGIDYTVFPPYSYRNFNMKGEVGREYTITARFDNRTISASSRILPPPHIDSLVFSPLAPGDSLRSALIYFKPAESDTTGCYVVFTRVRNRELRHYPGMLGTIETPPGAAQASVALTRGMNIVDDFRPDFIKGDTVDVILARVEPRVFRFWQAYNDAVYLGDNIFVSSTLSLPSNVSGGLGIFSARGMSRRLAIVN